MPQIITRGAFRTNRDESAYVGKLHTIRSMGTYHITAKIKRNTQTGSGMYLTGTTVAVNSAGTFKVCSATAVASTSIIFSPSLFRIGVNIHRGGTTTAENTTIANIMQARNLTVARMDLFYSGGDTATIRDCIQQINAFGGKVQGILLTQGQDEHDIKTNAQSLSAWEALNYSTTNAIVNTYKDIIKDFELLNEIDLRSEIIAQVPNNGAGCVNSSTYSGKTSIVSMYRCLKGMAAAISDIRASSGLALRVIVGTTGRDWGMLSAFRTAGLQWDMTGYHVYPGDSQASLLTDSWYGTAGPYTKLEEFGLPYTINEFHSGEIYCQGAGNPQSYCVGSYANASGDATTESGFSGLVNHMRDRYNRTANPAASMDSLVIYELLDESGKPVPENRFGLMTDLTTPKVSLYIATAFAGGSLSAAESAAIIDRGLMSAGEINSMKHI